MTLLSNFQKIWWEYYEIKIHSNYEDSHIRTLVEGLDLETTNKLIKRIKRFTILYGLNEQYHATTELMYLCETCGIYVCATCYTALTTVVGVSECLHCQNPMIVVLRIV